MQQLIEQCKPIFFDVGQLPLDERIDAINELRAMLHAISPFKSEPVDFVRWVKAPAVHQNDYNPNSVAPPEMELLRHSIAADGYCVEHATPILCADLVWRPAGSLQVGQEIIAFDEEPQASEGDKKGRRNFRTATVTFNEVKASPLVKVITEKDVVGTTRSRCRLGIRGSPSAISCWRRCLRFRATTTCRAFAHGSKGGMTGVTAKASQTTRRQSWRKSIGPLRGAACARCCCETTGGARGSGSRSRKAPHISGTWISSGRERLMQPEKKKSPRTASSAKAIPTQHPEFSHE